MTRRIALAIPMNVLVPGAGLVMLGRPWLGLSLGACFFAGAELGLLGTLVAPATLPVPLSLGALVWAGVSWLAGQILLASRIRFLNSPGFPRELAILQRLARSAINRGDPGAARTAVGLALAMNDADVLSQILLARLLTLEGRRHQARRAWARAHRLDTGQAYVEEIGPHLEEQISE